MSSVVAFVRQEQISVKKEQESEVIKWLEMHFRIAGLRPFSVKMSPNKQKEDAKHPDFKLYLRANVNKGDSFRDISIGSLWLKSKTEEDGSEKKYLTGMIEIPSIGKMALYVYKPKVRYEGEKIGFLYEVSSMDDTREVDNNERTPDGYVGNTPVYRESMEDTYIPDEEIPF